MMAAGHGQSCVGPFIGPREADQTGHATVHQTIYGKLLLLLLLDGFFSHKARTETSRRT